MRVALVHNMKRSYDEDEAEFDSPSTLRQISDALRKLGASVSWMEATDLIRLWGKLGTMKPDLVFNIAEGRGGPLREAQFPIVYEALGLPYTGSGPRALAVTQDKFLTKELVKNRVSTPAAQFFRFADAPMWWRWTVSTSILKPNFEGSSKGITKRSIHKALSLSASAILRRALKRWPDGILVEEYIDGVDVTVPWLERTGALTPLYVEHGGKIYDGALKAKRCERVQLRPVPAGALRDELQTATNEVMRELNVRDIGRVDFRVAGDRVWFLEVNALPSLERDDGTGQGTGVGAFASTEIDYDDVIEAVVESALDRYHGRR